AVVPESGPRPVPAAPALLEPDAAPVTGTPPVIPPIGSSRPIPVDEHILAAVAHGSYYQPHAVLGAHLDDHGHVTVRTLRRMAESVTLVTASDRVPMQHEYEGIWVAVVEPERRGHVPDYRLEVKYPGGEAWLADDPYRYLPTLGEMDLHLIGEGRHEMLWNALGAHVRHYNSTLGDISGTSFAVWAPNAQAVRVKGEFNGWDGSVHAMRSLGGSGVWELFIPDVGAGAIYKFELLGRDGRWHEKADPLARWAEVPPLTGSRVLDSRYVFGDEAWMAERAKRDPHNSPMSIYEVHLGSWRLGLGYRELAEELAAYVKQLGFTHVEFMPVAEHPFGGSWGYQVTSYYAPTSRFGHPDDFKYLVDTLHQAGIGVILDWVPAHFPRDEWALARFDGEPLYEHADPRLGEHPDWGTLIFDFGRTEVRNFLVANALYWLEEFHVDGLRVDAVASMLYRDYSRQDGQWFPNIHGGRENLEAISFLQEVNATAYRRVPGIVTIAEESTAFPGVTRPTSGGGLGFGLKWNMGWMHDTLEYISEDPVHRMYHHDKATFSMVYAFTENFLLPISHDEVVHGKGSMLAKMPGDRWKQLANLRAYLAFQWAHPGKQLIFMGTEFGQETEWSEQHGLDWWLAENAPHQGLQSLVGALNRMYCQTPALYERDNEPAGFQWIDASDGARNTLSFIRWDRHGNPLVCIANFAGHPHEDFRVGLPWAGQWTEVLNTDAEMYGGSGVGNPGPVEAVEGAWNGYPASAVITVPPLGVLYLKAAK
ncbi:1,4-alpha-glucan branching protein GlgB, partial [Arthrobacter sp. GCM10027362]|uniref:1,4-alpha-glucan branching protein GlgB n=1 Tax=Arthrobacter sp. GCM10027362 TaxID=3273379 RepID=UPI00363EDEF8